MPDVSENKPIAVIIPVWNRPDCLFNALTSLVIQTIKDFEVYITDDGSTEDIESVIKKFTDYFPITYLRHEERLGCGPNREIGLSVVKSLNRNKYVTFLDSDDTLAACAFEKLRFGMEVNDADIVTTVIALDAHRPLTKVITNPTHLTWLHGKMYRLSFLIDENIHFMPQLETNEDLCFNMTAYSHTTKIYHLDDQVYLFNIGDNSVTRGESMKSARAKCGSVDFIAAVYYAFKAGGYLERHTGTALNIYSYYQNAKINDLLTPEVDEQTHYILHSEVIKKALGNLLKVGLPKMEVAVKIDNKVVFYAQTFGQWIMQFFTQEEIIEILQSYQEEE